MVTIIAELGSNPAPRWDLDAYCRAAKGAGATSIKVQLFVPECFPPAERESKRAVMFPRHLFADFVATAHDVGLKAGASVFDQEAVTLALDGDFIKQAAREQDNRELTGWIQTAISLDGTAFQSKMPYYFSVSRPSLSLIWPSPGMPLFAIPRYPTPMAVALWRVLRMPKVMRCTNAWGWSSHTHGWLDCVWAVRLGASVIEKHFALGHFTLGWNASGMEAELRHSLMPDDFARMTQAISKIPNRKSKIQ